MPRKQARLSQFDKFVTLPKDTPFFKKKKKDDDDDNDDDE